MAGPKRHLASCIALLRELTFGGIDPVRLTQPMRTGTVCHLELPCGRDINLLSSAATQGVHSLLQRYANEAGVIAGSIDSDEELV